MVSGGVKTSLHPPLGFITDVFYFVLLFHFKMHLTFNWYQKIVSFKNTCSPFINLNQHSYVKFNTFFIPSIKKINILKLIKINCR